MQSGWLFSTYYTSKFATNKLTNRNDEARVLVFVYRPASFEWKTIRGPPSTTLLTSVLTACRRKTFVCALSNGYVADSKTFLSIVSHAKMRHVNPTTLFLGWFIISLARLHIISLCTKFVSFSFSHFWKQVTWRNHAPFRNSFSSVGYDQPVHQIWSLYVYSLRRYERRRKM